MPGVPPARYAYLGPEGTFTEQALRSLPAAAKADLQPCPTVTVALDAVREGEADGAVVPIENSVEGSVPVTLDELATGEPLMITREMTVPVAFSLLARHGVRPEDVRRVATHPHAAAQTRRWCALHLPDAEVVHTTSTAYAALMLTRPDAGLGRRDLRARGGRALPAGHAGHRDRRQPRRPHPVRAGLATRPATAADRARQDLDRGVHARDHPGALMEILDQLTMRGVNMTRIESRPTGAALGNYCFSVDCEGHVDDSRVGEALMGLRRVCADVRFLGSYERHDGLAPDIRVGTSDREFHDAAAWLARLRHGA